MISTGKVYGLDVNSLIDERRDPIKSSYAAAHYLQDLYQIFGDWTLVIAAYNCGPANVNKAIRRAGGSRDYWQIYPYLPQETRGYVPAFIAANYVMNYYCEHNICPMTTTLPPSTDTIIVDRDVHFDQIVAVCNVKAEEVKALNPQYRTGLIPGAKKSCILRLPTHGISAFIAAGDSVYTYKSDELFTNRSEVAVSQSAKKIICYTFTQQQEQPQQIENPHHTFGRDSLDDCETLRNDRIQTQTPQRYKRYKHTSREKTESQIKQSQKTKGGDHGRFCQKTT